MMMMMMMMEHKLIGRWPGGINKRGGGKDTAEQEESKYSTCTCLNTAK
jgi:hypothetical protein